MRVRLLTLIWLAATICIFNIGCGGTEYFYVQPKTEKVYGGKSALFSQTIIVESGESVKKYKRYNGLNSITTEITVMYPGLEKYVKDELGTMFGDVSIGKGKVQQDYDYRVIIEYREDPVGLGTTIYDTMLTLNFEGSNKYYTANKRIDVNNGFLSFYSSGYRDNCIRILEQVSIDLMQDIKEQILADADYFQNQ